MLPSQSRTKTIITKMANSIGKKCFVILIREFEIKYTVRLFYTPTRMDKNKTLQNCGKATAIGNPHFVNGNTKRYTTSQDSLEVCYLI